MDRYAIEIMDITEQIEIQSRNGTKPQIGNPSLGIIGFLHVFRKNPLYFRITELILFSQIY